jgi:hypothetical protein
VTDPRITGLLASRARALEAGDLNVARACTVELGWYGYRDEPVVPPLENTAAAPLPETRSPRGRPRKKTT